MIKLSAIFSDHALYLHSAPLTVRGRATNEEGVELRLCLNGKTVTAVQDRTDENGSFAVTFVTPVASFDSYEMQILCGEDKTVIKDVLFGELWLASGQSNMEMENFTQPECDEILDSMSEMKIRAFSAPRYEGGADHPYEPLEFYEGCWRCTDRQEHRELWEKTSATATAWARHLYSFLKENRKENIPVGFADLSKGGASMQSFLIKDDIEDKRVYEYLSSTGKIFTEESFNKQGGNNYQQLSAQYNVLIAPTKGIRYRGILWYQGECNLGNEYMRRIYGDMLKQMRTSYKKIFAADNDTFPLIASQIYPWIYTEESGECRIAYINKAIADLSKKYPREHLYFPVCDLKASFAFEQSNHPIHPTHKYLHGERMALLCENACYSRRVKGVQKLPPYADKVRIHDGRMYISFKYTGTGLHIEGHKLRGIYIRSSEGVYTPAESYIVDSKTLCVYHPFIKNPAHVAYAVSDFEHGTNLFAGEFPVTPFATDMKKGERKLNIEIKNFTNTELDGEVIFNGDTNGIIDCYRQPIFYPAEEGTTLVYDTDFSRSGRSLRVHGKTNKFGVYVPSRRFHLLDLENYAELRAWLLNTAALTVSLVLYFDNGKEYTLAAKQLQKKRGGWGEYAFDLGDIPEGKIGKMQFAFEIGEENPVSRYVNMDSIALVPKK